ncbi:MAG: P-II family nitrogen regulator [Phycisphaerae bacterium]|nr:P-II family nitrogen regulator [Phycisphaerae bacterium]
MKLVTAIIQPDRLNEVLDALEGQDIHLATVTHVLGRGRQRGVAEVYRGHKEVGSLLRKVKVEVAVNEEFVDRAIDAICTSARTEHIGDGKIFLTDLHECIRIRTGERGTSAIG